MRFVWCLLLLGCGLTGSEDDPEAREDPCPARDYRVDVVVTESVCTEDEPPGPEIACRFEGCDRAFTCEFDDGSREHNDGIAGPWVLEQGDCTVTYDVRFPRL